MALIISCTLSVILFLVRGAVPAAFGTSPEASALMVNALLWSVFAFPLIAVAKLFSSYFYAVGEDRLALLHDLCGPLFLHAGTALLPCR